MQKVQRRLLQELKLACTHALADVQLWRRLHLCTGSSQLVHARHGSSSSIMMPMTTIFSRRCLVAVQYWTRHLSILRRVFLHCLHGSTVNLQRHLHEHSISSSINGLQSFTAGVGEHVCCVIRRKKKTQRPAQCVSTGLRMTSIFAIQGMSFSSSCELCFGTVIRGQRTCLESSLRTCPAAAFEKSPSQECGATKESLQMPWRARHLGKLCW